MDEALKNWRDRMVVSIIVSTLGLIFLFYWVVGILWGMLTALMLYFYVQKHEHDKEFIRKLRSGDHLKRAKKMFHYTGSITTFFVFSIVSYLFAIQEDWPWYNAGTIVTGIIALLGLVWLVYAIRKR